MAKIAAAASVGAALGTLLALMKRTLKRSDDPGAKEPAQPEKAPAEVPKERAAEQQAEPNAYAKGITEMRSASKWLLAAFATVGALFGAGVQITGVGDLTDQTLGRALAAGVGYFFVVVGIVAAIAATSGVLRRDLVDLQDVLSESHLKDVRDNVSVAEPYTSVQALQDELVRLRPKMLAAGVRLQTATRKSASLPKLPDEPSAEEKQEHDAAEQEVRSAKAQVAALDASYKSASNARKRTLNSASLTDVRHRFQRAIATVCASAVVTACGLLAFVWGANPPDPETLATSPVLPQTPTAVKFLLTEQGRAKYQAQLGSDCPLEMALSGYAMSVSGQEYTVASTQTRQCKSAWLVLGPDLARVGVSNDDLPATPTSTETPPPAGKSSSAPSSTTVEAK